VPIADAGFQGAGIRRDSMKSYALHRHAAPIPRPLERGNAYSALLCPRTAQKADATPVGFRSPRYPRICVPSRACACARRVT
jgi:hypothetical protein